MAKSYVLPYEDLIVFIIDNFSSLQELNSLLSKYKAGMRLPNLGEVDLIINSNQVALYSIAGEISAGQLPLFGEKLPPGDLQFWLAKHYPTQDKLNELIDLYTGGGHLNDIHADLIVTNNWDEILAYFLNNDKPADSEVDQEVDETKDNTPSVKEQLNDAKDGTNLIDDTNAEATGVKSFSIELFNLDNMRKYKSFSDIPSQTEYYDVLQATLQMAAFSAKEMHWTINGPGFKGVHELLGEMYDKLEDYIDELVETRISNSESFDPIITSFIGNTTMSEYVLGTCPIATSLDNINLLLDLVTSNQSPLYADLMGRLTTDLNHWKFMFKGYLDAKDAGKLDDNFEVVSDQAPVTDEPETPIEVDPQMMSDQAILNKVKGFCTNKRQARCFNELVKSFKMN